MRSRHCYPSLTLVSALLVAAYSAGFSAEALMPPKEEEVVELTPFTVSSGNLGATPGGAKDINFFRMGANRGGVPHPNTITAEGLFSEHDLPLELGHGGKGLFRIQTAAMRTQFEALPNVRYLAQIGLGSGLNADTWQRTALNLVTVIDKSGSMQGQPLALVRESLIHALEHLRDGDQLAIVLYGDRAHVYLPTTVVSAASRASIATQIAAIASNGSTNMEAGLQLGYNVARESAARFKGSTRVMLFTDERPNVGSTHAASFMGLAEAASHDGIGLTTIGVGIQFGAELATKISSVRGGNLVFFEDAPQMAKTFASDFDTLVTELAHDFSVRIAPARGYRLEGVFGVPGELLHWDGQALLLDVATIFLSQRKGGIFFALAPETQNADLPGREARLGDELAEVKLAYREAGSGQRVEDTVTCQLIDPVAQPGLRRGALLVDEYLTLKSATQAHMLRNDQETAFRLVAGLHQRLTAAGDRALAPEIALVHTLLDTFALLSGRGSEIQPARGESKVSGLLGVWRRVDGVRGGPQEFVTIWPSGVMERTAIDRETGRTAEEGSIALATPLPTAPHGLLPIAATEQAHDFKARYRLRGDRLTLKLKTGRGSATHILERSSYEALRAAGKSEPATRGGFGAPATELDSLTGLPTPAASAGPTAAR